MLTPRENFLECIRGGEPDRYVKGYESPGPFASMGLTLPLVGENGTKYMCNNWDAKTTSFVSIDMLRCIWEREVRVEIPVCSRVFVGRPFSPSPGVS